MNKDDVDHLQGQKIFDLCLAVEAELAEITAIHTELALHYRTQIEAAVQSALPRG